MNFLDNYLKYLNEQEEEAPVTWGGAKTALKGAVKSGFKSTIYFDAFAIPGLWVSWRLLSSAFSKVRKRCGTFTRGPGRAMCIAREENKILTQKLSLLKKMNCSRSKNPDLCNQKIKLEVEKTESKIASNNDKLKEVNENYILDEINIAGIGQKVAKTGLQVGSIATMLGVGMVADKAFQIAYRSALAVFSKASRQCGVYKTGPERDQCISKYKLLSLNKQLNLIRGLPNCGTSQKCKDKLEDIMRQIQIQKDNIILYGKEKSEQESQQKEKRESEFSKLEV